MHCGIQKVVFDLKSEIKGSHQVSIKKEDGIYLKVFAGDTESQKLMILPVSLRERICEGCLKP